MLQASHILKTPPINPAAGRVQFLALAISFSVWAAYLQAGLPFDALENAILHRFGLATGWTASGGFSPQFMLALLTGTFWQFFARCRWPLRSDRSWGFYLGATLVLATLFVGLRYRLTEQFDFWPLTGILTGLALGGMAGWILALPLSGLMLCRPTALWRVAVVAAVIVTLLPLNTQATLAQTAFADWDLPERVYQLLKPLMLWGAFGMVCGICGYAKQARAGGGAAVFGFLACAALATENFRFEDVVEVMALLPGLAMGLWLGERSRGVDVAGKSDAVRVTSVAQTAIELMPAQVPEISLESESCAEDAVQSVMARFARRALAVMVLVAVGWALLDFPRWNVLLAAGFVLYLALLARYPRAWLLIVPAALPLFDLAFWTGRFFLDEFDLLLAVTMAALLWRAPVKHSGPPVPVVFVALVLVSVGGSGLIGLLPLQPLDANAFASYLSHYNSLRVAKGFLWGVVLFVLLRPHLDKLQSMKLLSMGMLTGLAGVALSALWEHWRFGDSAIYRVTATFSSMHIGGGHIEAYLVCALPFIWILLWQEKRVVIKAVVASVFMLVIYALITTVARGGIVALAVVFFILALGMYRGSRARDMSRSLKYTGSVLLAVGVAVTVAGIGAATFLQQRFSQTDVDAQTRFTHWSRTINLLKDTSEQIFGAGLGRFPERYFYANFDSAMGDYRYQTENDNHYLSLNSGGTLYMAQNIDIAPDMPYKLALDVRSNDQSKSINISVCEKKLFNSHLCQWLELPVTPGAGWQHQQIDFSSGELGQGSWWLRRPVQLSIYNPQKMGVVDVDNIRLTDVSGANLVSNGDFAKGGDYWFFKSGNHLAWHAKSMWVHLFFEQGLLGLVIFFVLTIVSVRQFARRLWAGEPQATVWLASLGGLLVVGFVDSLFDAPRLAMLLVLTLLVGVSFRAHKSV